MMLGQSRLREIFLKTDNVISGKYLAEITQQVSGDGNGDGNGAHI
jgi:AMP deaminase